MKYQNYIYSKTHDYYLILPMKTGTVTASWIFTYFDFFTYSRKFDDNNEEAKEALKQISNLLSDEPEPWEHLYDAD